jgi:hypothetical protein
MSTEVTKKILHAEVVGSLAQRKKLELVTAVAQEIWG